MKAPTLMLLVGCCSSCTGEISGGARLPPTPIAPMVTPDPKPNQPPVKVSACVPGQHQSKANVRRMTRWEYDNTVFDLLQDDSHPAADFGSEEEALGFNNIAEVLVTNNALAEKYLLASEKISTAAVARLPSFSWFGCSAQPMPSEETACVEKFVGEFGRRAFRRPLSVAEKEGLMNVYTQGKASGANGSNGMPLSPMAAGLRLVIQAALNAPAFLYRVELNAQPQAMALEGYELASRLSYLLWGSMPDEALFAAVKNGQLQNKADVAREATRMLADPKARRMVTQFHLSWLDFDRITSVRKTASVFPEYSPELGVAMQQETEHFIEHVVFNSPGTFSELLTAPYTVANDRLARHYDLTPVPVPQQWQKIDAPNRVGLLSQGSLMSFYAHSDQTSPVHRGKLIRENFFCQELAPPPPSVNITVPTVRPNSTTRERFMEHSSNPSCSGCHVLMDPIGFAFENYDSIGRFRALEDNKTIDATGKFTGTDVDGTFIGLKTMASLLAQSAEAKNCYVKQWFRFAYGRGEQMPTAPGTSSDACAMEQLQDAFQKSGGNVKDLLFNLTQSDAFLYRNGEAP
jgi:hypothetical protein